MAEQRPSVRSMGLLGIACLRRERDLVHGSRRAPAACAAASLRCGAERSNFMFWSMVGRARGPLRY